MILKRYAASIIQGCWDGWCSGSSDEKVSEAWGVRRARTVQPWIRPLRRYQDEVLGRLSRLWQVEEPEQAEKTPTVTEKRSRLLNAVRQAIGQSSFSSRTPRYCPYYHVQVILRAACLA